MPMLMTVVHRRVIARESNIVRVDFSREPDPPAPCFPGASGLRLSDTECDSEQAPPIAVRAAAGQGARNLFCVALNPNGISNSALSYPTRCAVRRRSYDSTA